MSDILLVREDNFGSFNFNVYSKVKLVSEMLEGIHFVAAVEAIYLGTKAGINPWILYDIISNAAGNSW